MRQALGRAHVRQGEAHDGDAQRVDVRLTEALVGEHVDGIATARHLGQGVLVAAVKLARHAVGLVQPPEEIDAVGAAVNGIVHLNLQLRHPVAQHDHRRAGKRLATVLGKAIGDTCHVVGHEPTF